MQYASRKQYNCSKACSVQGLIRVEQKNTFIKPYGSLPT